MSLNKSQVYCFLLTFSYLFLSLIGVNILNGEGHIISSEESGGSDLIKQALFAMLFLASLIIFKLNNAIVSFKNIYFYLVILFLGYALISVFWSSVPFVSFKRYILTLIVFVVPLLLVSSFPSNWIIKSFLYGLIIIVFLSIFASLAHPNGVHTLDALDQNLVGNWKGLFVHKNLAGSVASFAAGLFFIRYYIERSRINIFFSFVCFLFLYKTMSKTSIYILLPSILATFFILRFRSFKLPYVLIFLFFISPLIIYGFNYFVVYIDSPDSFTGRSLIWTVVSRVISDNYFFGVGFASVYHVGFDSILYDYYNGWVELVAHGHNGYLDLILYFGFIGFILFSISFIIPFLLLSLKVFDSDNLKRHFSIFAFVFLILHNIFESSFFNMATSGWVFFSIFFSMCLRQYSIVGKGGLK